MYQTKIKYFYEILKSVKFKYLLYLWIFLIADIGLSNTILPSLQIGQQQSIVGGDLTAVGGVAEVGVDWLAHSPSRYTYFLVSPSLSMSQLSGSRGPGETVEFDIKTANLAVGIHTRISDRLRLQARISMQNNMGGKLSINSESFEVDALQSIGHSWTIIFPYSLTYRIGLNITWQNQQITLKDQDEKIGLNSVIYGIYNSWRI